MPTNYQKRIITTITAIKITIEATPVYIFLAFTYLRYIGEQNDQKIYVNTAKSKHMTHLNKHVYIERLRHYQKSSLYLERYFHSVVLPFS